MLIDFIGPIFEQFYIISDYDEGEQENKAHVDVLNKNGALVHSLKRTPSMLLRAWRADRLILLLKKRKHKFIHHISFFFTFTIQ